MSFAKPLLLLAAMLIASGCATTATFDAAGEPWELQVQPHGPFTLEQEDVAVPFADTTFGRYSFKLSREGEEPFYGRLPQIFVNERILWDLLFPPLLAFNLREVYPYYQIDPDAGVIRYRDNEADEWMERKPAQFEIDRAKAYFRD